MTDASGRTLFGVSKTTIQGVLGGLIAVLTALLAYQVPVALQTPKETHIALWINVVINVTLIICRTVVGFLQGDAPLNP